MIDRSGPFASRNSRLFVGFTTFYNARAYYPVLAVFFTDLGLSIGQFVMLNAVWAAAIVLLEVPSGALADTLGRKRLLVFSAALMVVEMAILLVAPKDGGAWLFGLCLVNRFLSGMSEAAASGADEAIAYDALPDEGRDGAWDEVLATAMRWRSAGFLISMTLGGLLYDPSWWNGLVPGALEVPVEVARRLPVAVVFLQGLVCLAFALRFEESIEPRVGGVGARCASATRLVMRTAIMAVTTRRIAVVLAVGLLIDSVARNFATLVSEYYRLVGIPAWSFGLIGSLVAVGNWFVPGVAKRANERFSALTVLLLGGAVSTVALGMLAPAWPWVGLAPAMAMFLVMGFVGFTVSRFLHGVAESSQRATLLSVKGLVFNLGYGAYSFGFSLLLAGLNARGDGSFQAALGWQTWFFGGAFVLFALGGRRLWRSGGKPRGSAVEG
ncbi:MAG: MFS transporter [Verrucomicrobiota bacterium JB025]|nr:MFS transporter [Verrucomicrobiota bacterium JB025]